MIARNVCELFSSNHGVCSHLHEAHRIDELTRGSVLRLKLSPTTSTQNESVLCALFEFVDHGGCQGDTAQAPAQWRHKNTHQDRSATGGGIGRTVVRSPVVVIARHAEACPPPLGTHLDTSATDAVVLLFLLPVPSLVQPVYLSESILVLISSSLTSRDGDSRPLPSHSGPPPLTFAAAVSLLHPPSPPS